MEFILKVKYCCENHRLLHHPEDHEEPWPIIVKYKPGVSCCCCKVKEIICAERWAGWWWLPGTLTRERWSSARRLWWRGPTTRSQLLTAWNVSRLALRVDTWMQHISLLQELEEGVVCSDCGWPVCNAECSAGPNHQIECKVKNPDATIVQTYLVSRCWLQTGRRLTRRRWRSETHSFGQSQPSGFSSKQKTAPR